MLGVLFGSQPSRARRAVEPVEQPPWIGTQNTLRNVRVATPKTVRSTTVKPVRGASPRLTCLPRLLSDSYMLGNLTEASIQRWRGISDPTEKWVQMARTYNDLWKAYFDLLQPFSFISDSEVKYFVNFTRPRDECNVITMGIGGTVDGEKELIKRYPQCTFLGVDPNGDENRHLVEGIPRATFVQAAVAGGSGKRQAYLKQKNGAYSGAHVDHIGFIDLLKTLNGKRTVDLLIIDVEGAEYGILPLLTERVAELPIICQINVEIHTPATYYGYSILEFYQHFTALLLAQRYLPLNIYISGPAKYLRIFLVNIKDDVCVKKFLC